jgi:hypothetical protein
MQGQPASESAQPHTRRATARATPQPKPSITAQVEPATAVPSARLEQFLKQEANRRRGWLFRDRAGRLLLAREEAIDYRRITAEGAPLLSMARRLRVLTADLSRQRASWLIPVELAALSRQDSLSANGVELPIGTLVSEKGLYLKLAPGLEEVGLSDRGDVVLRYDPQRALDPTLGPVRNSRATVITGRARRLVTRLEEAEHLADRREALAWLKALERTEGRRTLISRFKCAGIDYEHRGNVPYLKLTTRINFFDPRDPEMAAISRELRQRFSDLGRPVPRVQVLSLMNLPRTEADYRRFLKRLGAAAGREVSRDRGRGGRSRNAAAGSRRHASADPAAWGLPATLRESRFFDKETQSVSSANFVLFTPLDRLGDRITVMTVNTDYHGEVKSRGVLSPLMSILSLVGIISAHAGAAVLTRRGTATTFTGPTGTGKTTAGTFWAEKNERYRRLELARRYRIDLQSSPEGRGLSEAAIAERARKVLETVGVLCQEDWIEIHRRRPGEWVFWSTERACYARTGGFPGLRFVLQENEPLLENAAADFGGSGQPDRLGRVTHDFFPERLFYDPAWGHMLYDRSSRRIGANVFLERNPSLDFCVKRVEPQEAIRWLLLGRTPEGKMEPLYNAYPDFSGLLMTYNIVGEKLIEAYEKARTGDFAPIGSGDARLGRAIFDKLDRQVQLWRENCADVPTYIVNGAPGLEITQDINWLLSEHPEAFGDWKHVTLEAFKAHMRERYGVTYGPRGEWTHLTAEQRRF